MVDPGIDGRGGSPYSVPLPYYIIDVKRFYSCHVFKFYIFKQFFNIFIMKNVSTNATQKYFHDILHRLLRYLKWMGNATW